MSNYLTFLFEKLSKAASWTAPAPHHHPKKILKVTWSSHLAPCPELHTFVACGFMVRTRYMKNPLPSTNLCKNPSQKWVIKNCLFIPPLEPQKRFSVRCSHRGPPGGAWAYCWSAPPRPVPQAQWSCSGHYGFNC